MARRKLPASFIPVRAPHLHPQLFPPPLTEAQRALLGLVDGMRDLRAIAAAMHLPPDTVVETLEPLLKLGEIREVTEAQMRTTAGQELAHGHHENAIRLFKRILARNKTDQETRRRLAALLERTAHPREAAVQYLHLAENLATAGDDDAARALYRKAALLQPNDTSIQDKVACICLKQQRIDEAAGIFAQGVRHHLHAGETDRARARLMEALERMPGHPLLLNLRGACFTLTPPHLHAGADQTSPPPRPVPRHLFGTRGRVVSLLGLTLLTLAAWHRVHEGNTLRRITGQIGTLLHEVGAAPLSERVARVTRAEELASGHRVLWPDHRRNYNAQRATLRTLAQDLLSRLDVHHAEQAVILDAWRQRTAETTPREVERLQEALELIQAESGSPHAQAAASALNTYAQHLTRTQTEQAGLLQRLRDPDAPLPERFAAYHRLHETPAAHPDGIAPPSLHDIALPVRFHVQSETGAPLAFRIHAGHRVISPDAEGRHPLPIDGTPIEILHPGWVPLPDTRSPALDGTLYPARNSTLSEAGRSEEPLDIQPDLRGEALQDPNGDDKDMTDARAQNRTRLPPGQPLRASYTFTMRRMPHWTRALPAPSVSPPVTDERGVRIFLADITGTVRALDRSDGRVLWEAPHNTPVEYPLLVDQGRVAALDREGRVRMLHARSGEEIWSSDTMVKPRGWTRATFTLALPQEPDIRVPDFAIAAATPPYLMALRGADGSRAWSVNLNQPERMGIGMPVGPPFHAGWHVLQMDRKGTLHIYFDHGTLVARIPLSGISDVEGDPLYLRTGRHTVMVVVRETGGSLQAYRVGLDAAPDVVPLWTNRNAIHREETLAAPLLADGPWLYAGFASGRLLQLRLHDGTSAVPESPSLVMPGGVTGSMDAGDGLLVATHFFDDSLERACVTAWHTDREAPLRTAWRYPLPAGAIPSGVRLFRDHGGRILILLQAGKIVYCFEEEIQPPRPHDR